MCFCFVMVPLFGRLIIILFFCFFLFVFFSTGIADRRNGIRGTCRCNRYKPTHWYRGASAIITHRKGKSRKSNEKDDEERHSFFSLFSISLCLGAFTFACGPDARAASCRPVYLAR